ncbi:sensor histidine kinase [Bacillus sp. PS06]|uniref:sensor histidine kinase n=1 Tax=Bacillus sp. PS06 TaxID=2764176 RepID=UPI00177C52DC|nr:sensor histidine kinase [Bacillus sp. PS06]MBD8068722.1 histidine kinase [Bacillus sp. PS06]
MLFSLRSRLMLTFFILVIVPIIVLSIVIPYQSTGMMEDQIKTSTLQTMDQYTLYINSITTQAEEMAKQVLVNPTTQELLSSQMGSTTKLEEKVIMNNQIKEFLSSIMVNNSNGISISIFLNDGTTTWVNNREFVTSNWFNAFSDGAQRWMDTHEDLYEPFEGRRVNSYLFPLFDINTLERKGVIKVNFPTSLLEDALNEIKLGETGRIYLLNWDGKSVLNQEVLTKQTVIESGIQQLKEKESGSKGVINITDGDDEHLVFYQRLHVKDWVLIGEVPQDELFSKINSLQKNLLYISLFLFLLTILASIGLSSNIARPLAKLAKSMRFIEKGDFSGGKQHLPLISSNQSEVGYVIKGFSHMVDRLEKLIKTEYEEKIRRKNAEYKALLLQINPHFLNNTLEVLGGLAAQGRNHEVMDVSESLGRMMRYSLQSNSDLVSLEEEIKYIHHFCEIVKLRYEDNVSITIDEDPSVRKIRIIKFILQPLVENAVKYSLEGKVYANIRISAKKSDDVLSIVVEDNGIGMSPQVVANLLEEGKTDGLVSTEVLDSTGRGIGFRNVIGRLKLYYEDRFWYTIDSQVGEGTKITLYIKLAEGE